MNDNNNSYYTNTTDRDEPSSLGLIGCFILSLILIIIFNGIIIGWVHYEHSYHNNNDNTNMNRTVIKWGNFHYQRIM